MRPEGVSSLFYTLDLRCTYFEEIISISSFIVWLHPPNCLSCRGAEPRRTLLSEMSGIPCPFFGDLFAFSTGLKQPGSISKHLTHRDASVIHFRTAPWSQEASRIGPEMSVASSPLATTPLSRTWDFQIHARVPAARRPHQSRLQMFHWRWGICLTA